MTEPCPTYQRTLTAEPDVVDDIIALTLDLQAYLAADPDPRAASLLAAAIDIIDALLAGPTPDPDSTSETTPARCATPP